MSTLAGAASAFVAILSGFYTTKVFSISTDKKRFENKINEINLELEHRNENAANMWIEIDAVVDQKEDERINYFVEELGSFSSLNEITVDSYENIVNLYKKWLELDSEPSGRVLQKLKDRSASIIEIFNPKEAEVKATKPWSPWDTSSNPTWATRIPTESERMIEHDNQLEERRNFNQLETDYLN